MPHTMEAYNGALKAHNGAVEAHNGAVEAHNGVVEAHNGSVEAHNGAMGAHNGAVEAHNGAVEAHNGAVEAYNGAVEAHNGAVEAHNGARYGSTSTCKVRSGSGTTSKWYGKSEPDLRQKEKLDPHPDSHHFDAVPQHCLCETDFCIIGGILNCQKVFVVLTNKRK